MTRKLITFLAIFLHFQVLGQSISKQDVITDLTFLNEAVINGHPVNYYPHQITNLNVVLDKARSIRQDSIRFSQFQFLIGEALFQIGCVHTSIKKNTLKTNQPISYFPLPLIIISNKLFVVKDTIYNMTGREITAVNGVSADDVINTMLHYKGSDGGGTAFAQTYFRKASSALLALYFDYPAYYQLSSGNEKIIVKAAESFVPSVPLTLSDIIIYKNQENTFSQHGNTAMLRLHTFSKTDESFFNSSMQYLSENNIRNLVIDLRGNTGGNRSAVISLAKHLVDTVFSYALLQPKLRTGKYVNSKGKLYLLLSKLKYNVGNVSKGKQTNAGREFMFRYQPGKEIYKGKIFVITDGFTASASTMLTSWLKQRGSTTFVGEQAGGGYNGNNGGSFPILTLPMSKVEINFPAYRLILDTRSDNRKGILPSTETPVTIHDIIQNRDVEMETIYSIIKSNK